MFRGDVGAAEKVTGQFASYSCRNAALGSIRKARFTGSHDAVTAANGMTPSGAGLVVEAGHNGETSYSEGEVSVTQAMTVRGVGTARPTVEGRFTVSGVLDGAFKVEHLEIDATGHDYAVFVSASSTGYAGSVTLDDVLIENAQQNGFAYIRAGNGSERHTAKQCCMSSWAKHLS